MENQTLHELLERLHAELRGNPSLNEADRALLQEVQSDILRLAELSSGGSANPPEPEWQEQSRSRLQEAALRFAVTHPKLANELDGMFNALSNAGL